MPERRSPRGYSLVEIVLVMLVMAITVAIGRPMLGSSLLDAALEAAVGETITAIQFAQSSAVGRGEDHRVAFDPNNDTVTLTRASTDSTQTAGIRNRLVGQLAGSSVESTTYVPVPHPFRRGSSYILDFRKDARFRRADIVDVDFGTKAQLTYDARGLPESGGTVRVSLGGRGVLLTVDAVTGRVTEATVPADTEPIIE
jgi:prepilin-type N-terminal cleavage/methylation domain-containing protein